MMEAVAEWLKNMMAVHPVLALTLATFIPFIELRGSIPLGIFSTELHGLHWSIVFLICITANILLAIMVYVFVNYIMHLFLRIRMIDRVYSRLVERTQKKVHPYVQKYGILGLALFIGIPLPGSGVYSGCLGAYLLGFDFKDYLAASVIGVMIAGAAILIISMSGNGALQIFIKTV
ncbi:hypothetical protein GF351_04840 [Candidatus Woesearchaeota archaeon]|nr:hypothetical protein [Candidatus Woesearchaeota archaeon]